MKKSYTVEITEEALADMEQIYQYFVFFENLLPVRNDRQLSFVENYEIICLHHQFFRLRRILQTYP
jgi:hypothetical protein